MADIATSILEVGSNRLILQDAEARTKINDMHITDTASGSIASFPDGADGVPVKSLKVNVEPVQSGSGDPSPDNVRPISGHTQAVVTRTGSNLLNPTLLQNKGFNINEGTFLNNSARVSNVPIQVAGGQNITVSVSSGFQIGSAMVYDGVNTYIGAIALPNWMDGSYTFALPSNARYFTVNARKSDNSDFLPSEIQMWFNYGSTATTYETYQGQTVNIDLDGTIYGGTLDVTTGVLTVDRALVDLGTLNWATQGNVSTYQAGIATMATPSDKIVCDSYKTVSASLAAANMPDKSIKTYGLSSGKYIIVKDTSYSTVADFKTALNGVQLCYELAEPFTVQLTAQEVSTLLGQNNIWADCGDTDVEYRADTRLYIDKRINEAVSALS